MDNKELRDKQKQEAIKRLEILSRNYGLVKDVVNDYKRSNLLYYSEQTKLGGILYWCTKENGAERFETLVREFEEEHNVIVYHVIHCYTSFGELLNLMYISENEEVWEQDVEDLKNGYTLAYAYNLDNDLFSEFGSIAITGKSGGMIRVS